MKLQCDICNGYFYSELGDAHDMGELNICSEHCVWQVSNNGEPRPPKILKEVVCNRIWETKWIVDERFEEIIKYVRELVEFYCLK